MYDPSSNRHGYHADVISWVDIYIYALYLNFYLLIQFEMHRTEKPVYNPECQL